MRYHLSIEHHNGHVELQRGREYVFVSAARDAADELTKNPAVRTVAIVDSDGNVVNVNDGGHWDKAWISASRAQEIIDAAKAKADAGSASGMLCWENRIQDVTTIDEYRALRCALANGAGDGTIAKHLCAIARGE